MILLYLFLGLFWLSVLLFVATQIVYPMCSNYKFFWIFTYLKIRRKYQSKFNEIDKKNMEKELQTQLRNK